MTGALLRVHYKGPNRRRLRRLGRRGELKTPVGTVGRRSGLLTSPAEFVSQHLRSSLHPGAKIQPWPGIRHGTSTTQDTLVPRRRTSQQKALLPRARRARESRGGCPACCVKLRGRLIVNVPSGTRRTRRIFKCGGRADSPTSQQQQLASQSSASPHGTKTTPCPASAGFWFTRPLGEAVDLLQARPLFRLQRSCKSQARAESSPCPGIYTRTFRSIASLAAPWRGAFPVSNPHAGAAPKLGSQVYGRCSWPAASRDSEADGHLPRDHLISCWCQIGATSTHSSVRCATTWERHAKCKGFQHGS